MGIWESCFKSMCLQKDFNFASSHMLKTATSLAILYRQCGDIFFNHLVRQKESWRLNKDELVTMNSEGRQLFLCSFLSYDQKKAVVYRGRSLLLLSQSKMENSGIPLYMIFAFICRCPSLSFCLISINSQSSLHLFLPSM